MPQHDHGHDPQAVTAAAAPAETAIRLPHHRLVRVLLGSLLLIHFGILFLNNLAWSPAIAAAWPVYSPYIVRLGLVQDWGMYRDPARFDQRIIVEGFTEAGRKPIPREDLGWTSSRMLYFVEAMCLRNNILETSTYLNWVYDQLPETSRPEWGLVLRRDVKQIPQPTGPPVETVWRTENEFFAWRKAAR